MIGECWIAGSTPPPVKLSKQSVALETLAQPEELPAFCLRPTDCRSCSGSDFGGFHRFRSFWRASGRASETGIESWLQVLQEF